jgi:glycosyltransferase involved in cell wall biosynthesis
MKIIRIIARLNVGGPAKHVTWLTDGLKDLGHQTMLVAGTVPPGEEDMTYFAKSYAINPLVIPEMSREISAKDIVTVWKLFKLFRTVKPDLVHTHTAKAGTVGRMAGLFYKFLSLGKSNCKFVHTYHGHIFHSYYGVLKTKIFLAIEKFLAWLATDQIIVLSKQQYREIHEEFGVGRKDQFAIMPLGLDLNIFNNWHKRRHILREELGFTDGNTLIGIVGRLTEVKNHNLFLQMAALYKKACGNDGVRFIIIGDGHLSNQLEKQVEDLGLKGLVHFVGMRDDPENFYPALDIVALTSFNEGTPLTLLEAMANERPIIATAVGGVVDLLGETVETSPGEGYNVNEHGVLVKPNDACAFSTGLIRLINNKELRIKMGSNGKRFVERFYSKQRLISDMAQLYDELLARSGKVKSNTLDVETV